MSNLKVNKKGTASLEISSQESELGGRIKEYRVGKGLTLQELADKTGFTKGYLSRIEKASKAPPVSTIINLAKALNVSIAEIFGDMEEKSSVTMVKAGERHVISRGGSRFGYAYQTLAHKFQGKHMEPYIMTLPATHKQIVTFQHKGEEILYVLQGVVKFTHGDKEFIAEEGDCLYFDSNVPHYGLSLDNKEVRCLMVIYVPE